MTADEIHQLGLREIERIETEMTAIAKKEGFEDLRTFRASLKSNPKYIPKSADQILDDFRHYIAQMEPKLPELFTLLPKSPVTVEAIPEFQAAAATHYVTGTPDGKRAGRVVVATSNFAERSLVLDEAIAYHEGIPGHHMQLSIQQQLPGCRSFVCTGWGSRRMWRVGRFIPSNWGRKWGSTRIRFRITGDCRRNFSERCGWWWTRGFIRRDGRAIRWWNFSGSLERWMSLRFNRRRIDTFPGRGRLWLTNWGN